jgi:hypothetical protein
MNDQAALSPTGLQEVVEARDDAGIKAVEL